MSSNSTDKDKIFEFIALVEDRPALWQKEHRDFMNRDVRAELFQEVAEICGFSEETCRKKLKNLKDKMRDISNKLPKTKNGQPAFDKGEEIVRWPFYHAMLFMKEQFMSREMRDALHVSAQEESGQEGSDCSAANSEDGVSSESSLPQPEIAFQTDQKQTQPVPRVSKKARFEDEFLSRERKKTARRRKAPTAKESLDPKDEWSAFCASVAYDLRKLNDPYLKMRVKSDINKIVNEAVLKQLQQNDAGQSLKPAHKHMNNK